MHCKLINQKIHTDTLTDFWNASQYGLDYVLAFFFTQNTSRLFVIGACNLRDDCVIYTLRRSEHQTNMIAINETSKWVWLSSHIYNLQFWESLIRNKVFSEFHSTKFVSQIWLLVWEFGIEPPTHPPTHNFSGPWGFYKIWLTLKVSLVCSNSTVFLRMDISVQYVK